MQNSEVQNIPFVYSRGSRSAGCCWLLSPFLPFFSIFLSKLSEFFIYLPFLLLFQADQEDLGDQEDQGHLWVPIKKKYVHRRSRNI